VSSFKFNVWKIERLPSGNYRLRWVVAGRVFSETFRTKTLADGYRARLLKAAGDGEPFDEESGLPLSLDRKQRQRTWYEHAMGYADMKWPNLAAKSRRSTAEALLTITPALVRSNRGAPDAAVLRRALLAALNPLTRAQPRTAEESAALDWIAKTSLPVALLAEPEWARKALNACARSIDGSPAAATTMRRKRAVFNNALRYAMEQDLLHANPLDRVQWKAAEVAENVDRRVVANPDQVRQLLEAVGGVSDTGKHLVAFFGCLYFAGMRPSEALALRGHNCMLPPKGWGRLNLVETEPRAGADWTDDGCPRETRGLKHRGEKEMRSVPIPPDLVQLLRAHIKTYDIGPTDRMFRTGRGGHIQDSVYTSIWRKARFKALSAEQFGSPLAKRPYDLRHAAISLWLNSGVPATEVARRAGQGVAVMLKVYANCVDGDEPLMNDRIEAALLSDRGTLGTASPETDAADPATHARHAGS
jgi:integrase